MMVQSCWTKSWQQKLGLPIILEFIYSIPEGSGPAGGTYKSAKAISWTSGGRLSLILSKHNTDKLVDKAFIVKFNGYSCLSLLTSWPDINV